MPIRLSLLGLMGLLLAACASPPAAPPPATATIAVAVPSATPTASPAPTFTTVATLPPPATIAVVTDVPTRTPLPPTPEATATSTATPEPVFLLSREDFGPLVNPFTGETVEDPAVLQRRPIACKISNAPPEKVRPQSGINDADVVFEHVNQWTHTRFTAIFFSRTAPDIGPLRSYRLFDLEVLPNYDAVLCTSGANQGVMDRFAATDFRGSIINTSEDGYYRADNGRAYEHTLYADPLGLWRALDARDKNRAPVLRNHMHFSSETPPGGEPATHVTIDYLETIAEWRYDPENGRYWRWSDSEPHIDANTGEQLNFRNVVGMYAVHVSDPTICAEVINGQCAASSMQIHVWGQGVAVVFRDGQMFTGTWRRDHVRDMFTFYNAFGEPIPLQVGQTWFQVLPQHRGEIVEVGE